jgi:hypothetical protein
MKFRISLVLLILALAASSAVTAQASCTDLTIKGSYAFTIHGQILTPGGPIPIVGLARTTFDGNGNLTQLDTVAVNGHIPLVWRPSTGTYTVNPNCTGTMTLITTGQPTLHLAILVSHAGDLIHDVVMDPGFAVTADAERVLAPSDED